MKAPISWRLRRPALRAGVLLLGVASLAQAHDFWVQPNDYWLAESQATPITLEVGHGPDRQRSSIPPSRILRFEAVGPGGRAIDLRDSLTLGGRSSDATIALATPGTYVLALQTDARARSLLPALRFNDYLRVEGLTPALRFRERTHRMGSDGSESYSRQAKAIVQVGSSPLIQSEVTRPVGLLLEIIPLVDPYAIPRPKSLPIQVLYKAHPLAGALVKLTDLHEDANPLEVHLTDSVGRATFTAPQRGAWLLNVIWTELAPATEDTDFATVFSSLSFGFSAVGPGAGTP
jgi:uncharacterized GH25 family protein